MNIVIDLRALQSGTISGVEVFVENVARALCENFPQVQFFLWTNTKTPLPENFPEFEYSNATRVHTRYSNLFLTLLASLFRAPKIDTLLTRDLRRKNIFSKKDTLDIVFVPDTRPTPVSQKSKKIMVVHDLSSLRFAKNFSLKTRIWHFLVRLKKEIQESAHILTPSRFTKEDLEKLIRVPHEKITVIHEGVSELLRPIKDPIELDAMREKYKLPPKFLLTLCTLEPRKNLRNLIEAFTRFQKRCDVQDMALVVAGKSNPQIFAEVNLPENQNIIFPGFIEEIDKPALFSAATAFIYPSFFEGFGLPVLEAMRCAIPVMCSDTSSLPEVCGDTAITFDPHSVTEISHAIETIYFNHEAQEDLAQRGLQRSKNPCFSWKTISGKVMAAFEEQVEKQ